MRPVVDRLKNRYVGRVNFLIFNVNDPQATEVAQRYRILAVPTFLIFDNAGRLKDNLTGVQDENDLANKFDRLIGR